MSAIILTSLEDALFTYGMVFGGFFVLVLAVCVIKNRGRIGRNHRLHLLTCEQCGMVFAVERFHKKSRPVVCPRCGKEQFLVPFSLKGKGD